MLLERRRNVRHYQRWAAEVTDLKSRILVVGVTRDVGLFGCFVETNTPFSSGRVIALKLTHNGQTLTVGGEVAYARAEGMGIAFGEIASAEYAVLKGWLTSQPHDLQLAQPMKS